MNNTSKIQAIIQKQKLLINPLGQNYDGIVLINYNCLFSSSSHLLAVVFKYLTAPKSSEQYIHHLYNDEVNLMIILFLKRQAQILTDLNSFQIDMTFKHVTGLNLINFGYVNPKIGRDKIFLIIYW